MASDLENQRNETFWAFNNLKQRQRLPEQAIVDFQFVPIGTTANWSEFLRELNELGFKTEQYEDGSTLEISTQVISLSADSIWSYEEQFTSIGRKHGFSPDGWGIWNDSNDAMLSD